MSGCIAVMDKARRPERLMYSAAFGPTAPAPPHTQPSALAVLDSIDALARWASSSVSEVGSWRRRNERPKGHLQAGQQQRECRSNSSDDAHRSTSMAALLRSSHGKLR